MNDINREHREVYELYIRDSHTWKKTFLQVDGREISLDPDKSCIVTAIYVPEHMANIWMNVYSYGFYRSSAEWFEGEPPLESVLLDARQLPILNECDISGLKRIIPCQPFMFLTPRNSIELDEGIGRYVIEYHTVEGFTDLPTFPRYRYTLGSDTWRDAFTPIGDCEWFIEDTYELLWNTKDGPIYQNLSNISIN